MLCGVERCFAENPPGNFEDEKDEGNGKKRSGRKMHCGALRYDADGGMYRIDSMNERMLNKNWPQDFRQQVLFDAGHGMAWHGMAWRGGVLYLDLPVRRR